MKVARGPRAPTSLCSSFSKDIKPTLQATLVNNNSSVSTVAIVLAV